MLLSVAHAADETIATGIMPADAILLVYFAGGQLGLIENKLGKGRHSAEQKDRHAGLGGLGCDGVVISATTTADKGNQKVQLVRA